MQLTEQNATNRSFSRTFLEEVDLALSAIDCVLNGEKAVYASTELTTGRRVASLLREIGAKRSSELRPRLGDEEYATRVWNPNVAAATAFARALHHSLGGNQLVITPAPFVAPGWKQGEYLAFWETLIRSRIKAVYFNDGWEFSNGCTFELLVALDAGLPTFAVAGEPLTPANAVALVEQAVERLRVDALDAEVLEQHLGRLRSVARQASHTAERPSP